MECSRKEWKQGHFLDTFVSILYGPKVVTYVYDTLNENGILNLHRNLYFSAEGVFKLQLEKIFGNTVEFFFLSKWPSMIENDLKHFVVAVILVIDPFWENEEDVLILMEILKPHHF